MSAVFILHIQQAFQKIMIVPETVPTTVCDIENLHVTYNNLSNQYPAAVIAVAILIIYNSSLYFEIPR